MRKVHHSYDKAGLQGCVPLAVNVHTPTKRYAVLVLCRNCNLQINKCFLDL